PHAKAWAHGALRGAPEHAEPARVYRLEYGGRGRGALLQSAGRACRGAQATRRRAPVDDRTRPRVRYDLLARGPADGAGRGGVGTNGRRPRAPRTSARA